MGRVSLSDQPRIKQLGLEIIHLDVEPKVKKD
jgi:hypothetical protein